MLFIYLFFRSVFLQCCLDARTFMQADINLFTNSRFCTMICRPVLLYSYQTIYKFKFCHVLWIENYLAMHSKSLCVWYLCYLCWGFETFECHADAYILQWQDGNFNMGEIVENEWFNWWDTWDSRAEIDAQWMRYNRININATVNIHLGVE